MYMYIVYSKQMSHIGIRSHFPREEQDSNGDLQFNGLGALPTKPPRQLSSPRNKLMVINR